MPVTDFSVFTTKSNVTKAARAVADLILADAQMASFLGARVYLTTGVVPDRPLPYVAVAPISENREFRLNNLAAVAMPVAVMCAYEELRDVLADSPATAEHAFPEFFNRLMFVVNANAKLENTRYGAAALAPLGIDKVETLDLLIIPSSTDEDGTEVTTTLVQTAIINYAYEVNADTGVVT